MDNIVYKYRGYWYYSEVDGDDKSAEQKEPYDEIVVMPITDSATIDTFIIRQGEKYGIYTLVTAMGFGGAARFISTDTEPFPYDEIKVRENYHSALTEDPHAVIGVRKRGKWGLMLLHPAFKYSKIFGKMARHTLVGIQYDNLEEAWKAFWGKRWIDPRDSIYEINYDESTER